MKIPILIAALLLIAMPGEAQVAGKGKKHGGKSASGPGVGKKSRVKGEIYDRGQSQGGAAGAAKKSAPGKRDARIRLGDRVRGFAGEGVTHRAVFEAVDGTELTVKITPADKKLTLAARLLGPDGTHLITPTGKASDPAVLRVDRFRCSSTGSYTLEVSFAASQSGDYLVETTADHPGRIEKEVTVAGRRPTSFTLSGLDRRRLAELKIRALDRDDLDLWLQLVDPDGVTHPLDAATWRSADGRTLIVSNVPLDRNGDYRLYVMDRKDGRAKVRVTARYEDGPEPRKTHEL